MATTWFHGWFSGRVILQDEQGRFIAEMKGDRPPQIGDRFFALAGQDIDWNREKIASRETVAEFTVISFSPRYTHARLWGEGEYYDVVAVCTRK